MSKKLLNIRIDEDDLNEFTRFCEENQVSKTEFILNAIYKAIGKEDVKTNITSIDIEAFREELLSEVDDRIKKALSDRLAEDAIAPKKSDDVISITTESKSDTGSISESDGLTAWQLAKKLEIAESTTRGWRDRGNFPSKGKYAHLNEDWEIKDGLFYPK